MSRASIDLRVQLPFTIAEEDGKCVASCEVLDVHSQGDNEEEASRNLHEAVQAFLVTCIKEGVVDQVLQDCGFHKVVEENTVRETRVGRALDVVVPAWVLGNSHGKTHAG